MGARLRSFLVGLVIGSVIAFMAGVNFGRDQPWLSNPFAKRDLSETVKEKAGELVEGAREKLHEVTRPEPSKPEPAKSEPSKR